MCNCDTTTFYWDRSVTISDERAIHSLLGLSVTWSERFLGRFLGRILLKLQRSGRSYNVSGRNVGGRNVKAPNVHAWNFQLLAFLYKKNQHGPLIHTHFASDVSFNKILEF